MTAFVASHWWPGNPGHVLVIPNSHFENLDEFPPGIGADLVAVTQRVAIAVTEPLARLAAWDTWWARAAHDPASAAAMDERRTVFPTSYPAEEFSLPAGWHIASLLAAGFTEATVTWRSGHAAVVTGLR